MFSQEYESTVTLHQAQIVFEGALDTLFIRIRILIREVAINRLGVFVRSISMGIGDRTGRR